MLDDSARWEFPRHQLRIYNMIGEGCFGQVWRCEADNIDGVKGQTTVAVKTLKESATDKERRDLLHELAVMKMLDPHPNVVRLLGCCTDKGELYQPETSQKNIWENEEQRCSSLTSLFDLEFDP